MITLVALPVVATWTVVGSVVGVIGWATWIRFTTESARIDAVVDRLPPRIPEQRRRELSDQAWIEALLQGREAER